MIDFLIVDAGNYRRRIVWQEHFQPHAGGVTPEKARARHREALHNNAVCWEHAGRLAEIAPHRAARKALGVPHFQAQAFFNGHFPLLMPQRGNGIR